MKTFRSGFARPLSVLAAVLSHSVAWACCAVSDDGEVTFGTQRNIVIWDSKKQIEHFVRNASFSVDGADLGFIAPTPTVPELSEADDEAFDVLRRLEPDYPAGETKGEAATGMTGAEDTVDVLKVQDVSGFRATVLRADDSAALAKWMRQNGYETSPDIERWTRKYVAMGWCLTAFKVLAKDGHSETGPVRMTFKSDRPFNPYYVPKSNLVGDGDDLAQLFVYFVSDQRYVGKIGGKESWRQPQWWDSMDSETTTKLETLLKLPPGTVPPESIVTMTSDFGFASKEQDDIYFFASPAGPMPGRVSRLGAKREWQPPSAEIAVVGGIVVISGLALLAKRRVRR